MTKQKNIPVWVADLMLLIVALMWGGGFVGVNVAIESIPPLYMIGVRFTIASLLLMALFFKKLIGFTKKDLAAGMITGFLLFLGFAFQTVAAEDLLVGKLAFLTALNVVMVPFFAFMLYKEKLYLKHVISSVLAIVGIAVLNLNGGVLESFQKGDVLAILGALAFAGHITALGYFAKRVEILRLAIFQMFVVAGLGFIGALVFEEVPSMVTPALWGSLLYLGVFSTFLAFLFQTIAQKYTSPARASLIMCLESVFGTILGVIVLKEVLTINMIIGCSLIFTGVILSEYSGIQSAKKGR